MEPSREKVSACPSQAKTTLRPVSPSRSACASIWERGTGSLRHCCPSASPRASGSTTSVGRSSSRSGRAASSSRPRGSSCRDDPRACCLPWSPVPTRGRRPSTCATGACPAPRAATCADAARWSGLEPRSPWDGPPSSAAPSSSPRSCPSTCSPTRSTPGRSGTRGLGADHGGTAAASSVPPWPKRPRPKLWRPRPERVPRRPARFAPADRPQTVCTDGWDGTQSAWRSLFPAVCSILCFLHSVRNVAERGGRDLALRTLVLDRVWEVDDACTRAQCSQRLRRLREWATTRLSERARPAHGPQALPPGPTVRARVPLPWCASDLQRPRSAPEPSGPAPLAMRDCTARPMPPASPCVPWPCRGTSIRTGLAVAATIGRVARRSTTLTASSTHPHWLHNLLIASSMGGRR